MILFRRANELGLFSKNPTTNLVQRPRNLRILGGRLREVRLHTVYHLVS